MNDIVYLNGSFISHADAKISADDRGFHFADGVYEVVKYYTGKAFRLEDHLERLERSLSETGIRFEKTNELPGIFRRLLEDNQLTRQDAGVYIQISRGTHPRVHHFPAIPEPTVYIFAFPFPSFRESMEMGVKVITAEDIRWLRCDIKSVCLLPNSMLFNKAVGQGAMECMLVRNGRVTEATHSSVIGIKDGTAVTHPVSNLILPGITRGVVLEICRETGIPVREEAMAEEELYQLDELIICGTGSEVMPVVQVNDRMIGNGRPGPVTRMLQERFFEMVKQPA